MSGYTSSSSYLTQRIQSKQIAKSFLGRLNTGGTVNQTTSYGPPLGIWDVSIMNEVNTGTMNMVVKTQGGITDINQGCCADSKYEVPNEISNIFIYLSSVVVTWLPPSNFLKCGPISYTVIAISSDGGDTVSAEVDTLYCEFNNLTPYKYYTFTIVASNASGSSPPVISYQIYAPPLLTFANSLDLSVASDGTALVISDVSSISPYTFVKQNIDNIQSFGTTISTTFSQPNAVVSSMFVLSKLVVFLTTHSNDGNPPGCAVWKSIDGGLSWSNITDDKIFNTGSPFPDFSYWWNINEGVVIGDRNISGTIEIYYTTNGGNTWSASTGITGNAIGSAVYSNYYSVIGDTIWIVSFEFPSIIYWVNKSTDRGKTWVSYLVSSDVQTTLTLTISFADVNNGVLSNSNNMWITTDGGSSWSLISPSPVSTIGIISTIECINLSLVYILSRVVINGLIVNALYKSTNLFSGTPTFTFISSIDQLTPFIKFKTNTLGYATTNAQSINGGIKKYLTSVPSTPSILNVYPGSGCALINIATYNYEFPVIQLQITPYDSNGIALSPQTFQTTYCNVTGLTNSQPYTFSCVAIGEYGNSAITELSSPYIPLASTVPQPTSIANLLFSNSATGNTPTISIRFVKPQNDGGSTITSYTLKFSQGDTEYVVNNITSPVFNYTNPLLNTINPIINASVFAVNTNGNANDYLNALSNSYISRRIPTITFVSKTTNSITINAVINNNYLNSLYVIYVVNANTFEPNITCSPNLYSLTPATGANQNITISDVTNGNWLIYASSFDVLSGYSSAYSSTILVTIP